MSWSTTQTVPAGAAIGVAMAAIRENTYAAPESVQKAVEAAVESFKKEGSDLSENDLTITSYGHIGTDGQGNCQITINATKPAIDATTQAGATELAEKLRGA